MKAFQRLLVSAPVAALLPVAMAPAGVLANDSNLHLDQVEEYSVAQGASIRDFSDVYPTDWAYQALAELVDTYGCVGGYPDGTFRGQQPITRFEMAAVLNKCMNAMSAKMDMMSENMSEVSMEDMETLERLVASFEEELITLKGSVDGLDAKVSELEDSQFSTTTKASFKIATDFVWFSSKDEMARAEMTKDDGTKMRLTEKNSGVGVTSSAEIAFKTSFTGSDKLTFKLKGGDVVSRTNHYLASGNFYDVADGDSKAEFGGFVYESGFDLGGIMGNLVLGTDVKDLKPIVGLDTYYGGSGYDHYGPGDFGGVGIGFNVDLLSSNMGSIIASSSYSVKGEHASDNMMGKETGLFGEKTDRSGVLALSWDGALFGGNDALFTVAYQNIKENDMMNVKGLPTGTESTLMRQYVHLVAGAYFTDSLSLSGRYSFGTWDYKTNSEDRDDPRSRQWMVAVNMDDAFFPGNSAGIAYGTPEYVSKGMDKAGKVPTVVEIYYAFKVNDNFKIPVYLDFINNIGGTDNADAFGLAVRPTLTF